MLVEFNVRSNLRTMLSCVVACALACPASAQESTNSWWDKHRAASERGDALQQAAQGVDGHGRVDMGPVDTRPATLRCPEVPKAEGIPRARMFVVRVDGMPTGENMRQMEKKPITYVAPGLRRIVFRQQMRMIYQFHRELTMEFVAQPGKSYLCTLDQRGDVDVSGSTRIVEEDTGESVGKELSTTCFYLGNTGRCGVHLAQPEAAQPKMDSPQAP